MTVNALTKWKNDSWYSFFDVFELLCLPFDYGFPRSSFSIFVIWVLFRFYKIHKYKNVITINIDVSSIYMGYFPLMLILIATTEKCCSCSIHKYYFLVKKKRNKILKRYTAVVNIKNEQDRSPSIFLNWNFYKKSWMFVIYIHTN